LTERRGSGRRVGQAEEFIVVDLYRRIRAHIAAQVPSTPKWEALHYTASTANLRYSGSKYIGLGAKEAPALCSMPWSTGKMIGTCIGSFHGG